jgi:hypothetical protein
MKFPVKSLLAGNLAFSETSSQLTPPSSGESCANLTWGEGAGRRQRGAPVAFGVTGEPLSRRRDFSWARLSHSEPGAAPAVLINRSRYISPRSMR